MSLEQTLRILPLLLALIILCLAMIVKYIFGITFESSPRWATFAQETLTFTIHFYILLLLGLLLRYLGLHNFAATRISYMVSGGISVILLLSPSGGGIFNMTMCDVIELPAMYTAIIAEGIVSSPKDRAYDKRLTDRTRYVTAIENGDFGSLKTVPKELIDGEFNQQIYSLVVHAAVAKRLDMVQLLVTKGASLDKFSEVLYYASANSNSEIVKYLVEQGAEPVTGENWDQFAKDRYFHNFNYLPIMQAAVAKKWDIVELLLVAANAKTAGRFSDFVLLGAGDNGNLKLAQIALQQGAHSNAETSNNDNFLMLAIRGCDYGFDNNAEKEEAMDGFFRLAVDNKIDLSHKDSNGNTIFDLATERGKLEHSIASKYRRFRHVEAEQNIKTRE